MNVQENYQINFYWILENGPFLEMGFVIAMILPNHFLCISIVIT